ncbi:MAG: hypothetical protein A3D92_10995 [Bacteroidetes bacterium RIFCSPHIGHO2_02_FULL_44_7]|nr:MAG: hypothetical protein A3D92_10995 [Bacteroidetes bacterium RIFCSPHIGHO2_02_FULL_44_7]
MNKFIAFCCACLTLCTASAQYGGREEGKSRFRPGAFWMYTGIRPAKLETPAKYDRLIVDLTYNDWIGDRDLFKNHWASMGVNTNFIFDIPLTKKVNKVSFGIGISHEYTSIRHNAKLVIDNVAKTTTYMPKDSSDLFRRSSLSGHSFSVPIEFRFRTKHWKHFKFHIGGKVGYQVSSLSKYVSKIDGHKVVNKQHGFPDDSKLIYSAHIRIGVRNWALFASYSFNPLFTSAQSTRLNRVQMGLSLSLF